MRLFPWTRDVVRMQSATNGTTVQAVYFGSASPNRRYVGTPVTVNRSFSLEKIRLKFSKLNSPVQTIAVHVYSDNAGSPGTLIATASNTFAAADIVAAAWVDFNFTPFYLVAGAKWIVCEGTPTINSNIPYVLSGNGSVVTNKYSSDAVTWTAITGTNTTQPLQYEMHGIGAPSPSALFDFSSGNDGDALSDALAIAGTRGTNVIWTTSGNTLGAIKISTAQHLNLPKPVIIGGVSYGGSGNALLCDYRAGPYGTSQVVNASFTSADGYAKVTYAFRPHGLVSNWYYTLGLLGNANGDFVNLMFNGGKVYCETPDNPNGDPDTGAKYTYTEDTWYWVQHQFKSGGPHTSSIYDASGNLVSRQTKVGKGAPNNGVPVRFQIQLGDSGQGVDAYFHVCNIVLDFSAQPEVLSGSLV